MKKKLLAFAFIISFLALAGCSTSGPAETSIQIDTTIVDSNKQSNTDTVEEVEAEETESPDKGKNNQSEKNKDVSAKNTSNVLFVPQKSDIESGYTVENDAALKEMERLVLEADESELGITNDVAVHFTGLYLEGETTTDVIFIIVNKTSISMTNMEFNLSLGTAAGEMVLDRHPILLSEDVFGILEPNTAMPLYITIESGKKPLLQELVKERKETISLDNFKYQEINSETQDISGIKNKNKAFSKIGKAKSGLSANKKEEPAHHLSLQPQLAELEQGLEAETDPTLNDLERFVQSANQLGIENEVTVQYTGMFLDTVDGASAIFLVINRTDEPLTNIKMELSFFDKNETALLDKEYFYLKEDQFGTLNTDTAMPLYVGITEAQLDSFLAIEEITQANCRLDSLSTE